MLLRAASDQHDQGEEVDRSSRTRQLTDMATQEESPEGPARVSLIRQVMVDTTARKAPNHKIHILQPVEPTSRQRRGQAGATLLAPERSREIDERAAITRWWQA